MTVKQVIDHNKVGRKGVPRHYQAFGIEPPMREVVETDEGETPVSSPPTEDDYAKAIQQHMNGKAAERRYDSIQTAVTYRDDPNPQFAAEGQALFDWRSEVWTYATAELEKVRTGQRSQPTVAEFLAELPKFTWPA